MNHLTPSNLPLISIIFVAAGLLGCAITPLILMALRRGRNLLRPLFGLALITIGVLDLAALAVSHLAGIGHGTETWHWLIGGLISCWLGSSLNRGDG